MAINSRHIVCNMSADGMAYTAGVRKGDTLIRFDGKDFSGEQQLFQMMLAAPDGKSVEFVVNRPVVEKIPDNAV